MEEIEIKRFGFRAWIARRDSKIWVAVRSICQILGIAAWRQESRITKDSRFRWQHMLSPSAGGNQRTLCIPCDEIAGWLWMINPNKVKTTTRPLLMEFQRELQGVIKDYIEGRLTHEVLAEMKETIVQLRADLIEQRIRMGAEIDELRDELRIVGKAHRWSGSAASYNMHARREMKKLADSRRKS
jgi:hypothetical protein